MIRSVLVPLDGSSFSEHALPLATKIARRADATLSVVRVHHPLRPAAPPGPVDEVDLALKGRAAFYLQETVSRLNPNQAPRLTTELLEGDVVPALCARAAAADLVVMTTHGRGALGRLWLGSVADELMRVLPVPVLLVRPQDGPANLSREPACDRMLVPLDGTPLAEQVLDAALDVGTLLGSSFTLVRVVKPALVADLTPQAGGEPAVPGSVLAQLMEIQRQLEAEAAAYLDTVAARLAGRGLTVQTRVLVDEQPAAAVLRVPHADLIALATHGRRGLPRLLLGSVADKLVRGSTLPILLFRPRPTAEANSHSDSGAHHHEDRKAAVRPTVHA